MSFISLEKLPGESGVKEYWRGGHQPVSVGLNLDPGACYVHTYCFLILQQLQCISLSDLLSLTHTHPSLPPSLSYRYFRSQPFLNPCWTSSNPVRGQIVNSIFKIIDKTLMMTTNCPQQPILVPLARRVKFQNLSRGVFQNLHPSYFLGREETWEVQAGQRGVGSVLQAMLAPG